jgi:hypothetical protein
VAIRRGGLYFVVHIALMIRECLRAPRRNWKLRVFVRLYFFSPTPCGSWQFPQVTALLLTFWVRIWIILEKANESILGHSSALIKLLL